jgi:glycerophosphoryl diester phosphodiesterase
MNTGSSMKLANINVIMRNIINGYRIDAWTVDSEENIRDLIQSNVDILTTKYLERAIAAKQALLGE